VQGVHREVGSEEHKTKIQTEAKANQRWLSASTIRHRNGEVSYRTNGSVLLRGSVQKESEDAGSDYGRYGREAADMTTGDLLQSAAR